MTFDSKEYRARPEIKAQSKEYCARPEIKARKKEYHAMLRERQKFLLDNPDEIEKLRVKMMRDLERGFI